jgi:hypothetical protein
MLNNITIDTVQDAFPLISSRRICIEQGTLNITMQQAFVIEIFKLYINSETTKLQYSVLYII